MSTKPWSQLLPTSVLAEHSAASRAHFPSFLEDYEQRPCPGGLEWLADAGSYLMSTGNPPFLRDPNDLDSGNMSCTPMTGDRTAIGGSSP